MNKNIAVYSIGNGQVAVVVAGEDYKVFDTPAEAKQYIESIIEFPDGAENDR